MKHLIEVYEKNRAASMKARNNSVIPYEIVFHDSRAKTALVFHVKIPKALAEDFIVNYMKSFEVGGVNFHISESIGYIPYPNKVVFRNVKKGEVLWEWIQPQFFAW